jgi:DNA-binding LacI/PurR family transcriptional regulator
LGYAEALKRNGLKINPNFIVSRFAALGQDRFFEIYNHVSTFQYLNGNLSEHFTEVIRSMYEAGVSAAVGSNDFVAMYLIKAFEHMGIPVPGGVSVTGFDDHSMLRNLGLSITTVRQNMHAIGARAAEMLLTHIADPGAPVSHVVLPVQPIERGSSGEANGIKKFKQKRNANV